MTRVKAESAETEANFGLQQLERMLENATSRKRHFEMCLVLPISSLQSKPASASNSLVFLHPRSWLQARERGDALAP